jgi:hypothetical protein
MKPQEQAARLVEATYGKAERARFLGFDPADDVLAQVAEAGRVVLARSPPISGACTYMTAAWVSVLRGAYGLPAYFAVGDLRVRGRWAFRVRDARTLAGQLDESSDRWDGHCWLLLGNHVGDMSVCRTAYAQPEGSNLRAAVLDEFGPGRGLFLSRRGRLSDRGFEYTPMYVASDEQIDALVNGAVASGRLKLL